jgi:uncharacterized membrane-anchored protein YitT (DUF2179 family)
MYFWNLRKLKDELRQGPLPARAARSYLIGIVALYYVSYVMERLSKPLPPMTALDWVSTLMGGIGYLLAIVLAYRANGGAGGADFIGRYLSLGWVIGIRLGLAVVPVCLVGAIALTLGVTSQEARHEYIRLFGVFVVTGIGLSYALALAASMRDVARTPPEV